MVLVRSVMHDTRVRRVSFPLHRTTRWETGWEKRSVSLLRLTSWTTRRSFEGGWPSSCYRSSRWLRSLSSKAKIWYQFDSKWSATLHLLWSGGTISIFLEKLLFWGRWNEQCWPLEIVHCEVVWISPIVASKEICVSELAFDVLRGEIVCHSIIQVVW